MKKPSVNEALKATGLSAKNHIPLRYEMQVALTLAAEVERLRKKLAERPRMKRVGWATWDRDTESLLRYTINLERAWFHPPYESVEVFIKVPTKRARRER